MTTSIFDTGTAKSLSFKGAVPGTSRTVRVTGDLTKKQQSDFETGQPAVWDDGNPKLAVVVPAEEDGEAVNVWVPIPSNLLTAFQTAQREIGRDPREGDEITVTFTGETPNAKNPRLNPAKNYTVKINAGSMIADAGVPAAASFPTYADDDVPFG